MWEPLLFKFKALPLRADHQPHLIPFCLERAGQGCSMVTSLASLGSLSLPLLACTAPGSLADKRVSYLGCLLVGASLLGLPHPQPCSGALGAGWWVPSLAGVRDLHVQETSGAPSWASRLPLPLLATPPRPLALRNPV